MKKVNPNRMGLPPVESYIKKYNYKDGEGHLYIVKPWPDLEIFKVGITTALENRMYWYDPGVELLYLRHTKTDLRFNETLLIRQLRNDPRFTLVKGREYFSGPVTDAIHIINNILDNPPLV